jgi:hypothetical protein
MPNSTAKGDAIMASPFAVLHQEQFTRFSMGAAPHKGKYHQQQQRDAD